MNKKRVLSFLLAMLMALSSFAMLTAYADEAEGSAADSEQVGTADKGGSTLALSGLGYFEYLAAHKDAAGDITDVKVDVLNYVGSEGVKTETLTDGNGKSHEGVTLVAGGNVEWTVNVEKSGFYNIKTLYLPIQDKPINSEIRLYIDGITPFTEATSISFSRIWTDVYAEDVELNEYGHRYDSSGNELSPESVEVQRWTEHVLHDNDYMTDADYLFYFEQGTHTLRFESQREAVCFAELTLSRPESLISYEEYKNKHKDAKVYSGDTIKIEAENAYEHSDRSLSMVADYSSASTSPSHPSQIRLNTIGGENWNKVGQWISWEVDVKESGFYTLSFKYIQNYVRGFRVYRTIMVDGAVPYQELETVAFDPNNDWGNYMLSDEKGNPYYIYLEEGKRTITLKASLGQLVDSLQELQKCINQLNADYLEIIAVTGTTPDSLRTYNLDIEIPHLIDSLKAVRKRLVEIDEDLGEINGGVSGGMSAFISVMVKQLDKFIKNPLEITTGLSAYKSNISSLSDMLTDMTNQSLLLDTIYVGAESEKSLPKTKASFWDSLVFGFKAFFASFVTDYNAYGSDYSEDSETEYICEPVEVWMSAAGRDQFNVLKSLIDDKFVPEYKIPVTVSLVPVGSALTQAILAGVGPDACLYVDSATPVNYSMRGSLEDMDQFNTENQYDENGEKRYRYTFDEVKEWFYPSAFVAIEYFDGKVYGLPETQNFQMMFYRTDVLADLEVEPPQTWKELRDLLNIIQRQNMNIGINSIPYATYLYQNGGTYYNESRTATNFNNQTAIDAFITFNRFYTDYDVPISYDALNRFRSGEYPIIMAGYSFFNNLAVGAPEIKGLWKMAPIPGTEQEDGTISRAEVCDGTVCIMVEDCDNKEQVWDFMSWWVSADTQATYGNNIEARLGAGGRYSTANLEAFEMLPWSYDDAQSIKAQWKHVTDFPKVPGDYYVTRMLNNAHRAVLYKSENPRAALISYSKDMDKELERKYEQYRIEEIVADKYKK